MMKKLVCLVLALMLALCAMIPALAEGRKSWNILPLCTATP